MESPSLGPGQLLGGVSDSADTAAFDTLSLTTGGVLVIAALVLARHRHTGNVLPVVQRLSTGSTVALGAAVTALDLPTAFPYFAAIGAVAESGVSTAGQLTLLVGFYLIYVPPLLLIAAARTIAGDRVGRLLTPARGGLDRVAPRVASGLTAVTGAVLICSGASGLLS